MGIRSEKERCTWAPVSYTHLDVYKRQAILNNIVHIVPGHHLAGGVD